MINNVIFDFGQVLVRFDPIYMTEKYAPKEHTELLASVIFDRLYWDKLDAGTISDDEVVSECKKRLPESLRKYVDDIYYNWIYNIPEIDGMRSIIEYVREKGKKLFILSNISTYFAENSAKIPILKGFDGYVFSAVCGKTKPSHDIFDHLCKQMNISPEESVFIDDSEKNVAGAASYGINCYLFDGDVAKLKRYLDTIL